MDSALERLISVLGKEEAMRLVLERPQAILDNVEPGAVASVPGLSTGKARASRKPWYRRVLGG